MTPELIEKVSLVAALVVAVVYLWKAYQAAVDRSLNELKEALAKCEEEVSELQGKKPGAA